MFTGKQAYADAYANLCKKAGIECETVSGIAKTGDYNPGDLEIDREKMKAYWNKVKLLGKWWPIHPRYVLRAVKGTAQASGYTKIDSDLKDDNGSQSAGPQQTEITFNDFWFLADPEIFINKCYPDDPEDQMLPAAKRIKKPRNFMKLPYLTPVFHEYRLKLTSEETCIIDSIEGLAKISFKASRTVAKDMACDYTLSIENRDGTEKTKFDFETSRLVFSSRKKNQFIFEVRCPVEANYQLVITGGKMENENKKVLIKCKIVCREKMPVARTLPIDAGQTGWGFGPVAAKVGLSKPKIKEPKVFIKPKSSSSGGKTTMKMRFTVDKDMIKTKEYTAELNVAGKPADNFKGFVKTNLNKESKELQIECSVPEDGEYALVIKAKDRAEHVFKPVCYYLLTTLEDEEKMSDDYYDSSDGTSDIDEEIDQLESTLKAMTAERDRLKQHVSRQ
ncbi:uncharacterized protein LOC128555490 [Mercenaria mercenaria]|nr:uncharacterized protein LOC128555490 [Mercenaria mercenaria]